VFSKPQMSRRDVELISNGSTLCGNEYKSTNGSTLDTDGYIAAEPLYWYTENNYTYACFGDHSPSQRIHFWLQNHQITLIHPT
jgi:hypothetical protein